jgi:hypothetical protein
VADTEAKEYQSFPGRKARTRSGREEKSSRPGGSGVHRKDRRGKRFNEKVLFVRENPVFAGFQHHLPPVGVSHPKSAASTGQDRPRRNAEPLQAPLRQDRLGKLCFPSAKGSQPGPKKRKPRGPGIGRQGSKEGLGLHAESFAQSRGE